MKGKSMLRTKIINNILSAIVLVAFFCSVFLISSFDMALAARPNACSFCPEGENCLSGACCCYGSCSCYSSCDQCGCYYSDWRWDEMCPGA